MLVGIKFVPWHETLNGTFSFYGGNDAETTSTDWTKPYTLRLSIINTLQRKPISYLSIFLIVLLSYDTFFKYMDKLYIEFHLCVYF